MKHIGMISGTVAAGALTLWWGAADLIEWCVEVAVLAFIGGGLGYSFDNLRAMVAPNRRSIKRPADHDSLEDDWHHQSKSTTEGADIMREVRLHFSHLDHHKID